MYQEATVGTSYTTELEQLTTCVGQLYGDKVEQRRCQTAGCQFYALEQYNWKCSRCYVNESTSSQSASSTVGHVQQMTSHTKAQSLVEEQEQEQESQWNCKPALLYFYCSLLDYYCMVLCLSLADLQHDLESSGNRRFSELCTTDGLKENSVDVRLDECRRCSENFTQQTQAPANRNARSKQWQP